MLKLTATSIHKHTLRLKRDTAAAGALEYALLISFLALAIIAGATTFGSDLSSWFTTMGAALGSWAT